MRVSAVNFLPQLKTYKTTENPISFKRSYDKYQVKKDLAHSIENKDFKTIFNYFGMRYQEDKDGFLTLDSYHQPGDCLDFWELGINEDDIFQKVKKISGNAVFDNRSRATNLGALEEIGGSVNFCLSKVTDLGNLKKIGGSADFAHSNMKSLKKLERIGGNAYFEYSKIEDLGKLQEISGLARFCRSRIESLGELKRIGGAAGFGVTKIKSLGKLQEIGGDVAFEHSEVEDLGALYRIGGNVEFRKSKVRDLKNLTVIGGDVDFRQSVVGNIGMLHRVGGEIILDYPEIDREALQKALKKQSIFNEEVYNYTIEEI